METRPLTGKRGGSVSSKTGRGLASKLGPDKAMVLAEPESSIVGEVKPPAVPVFGAAVLEPVAASVPAGAVECESGPVVPDLSEQSEFPKRDLRTECGAGAIFDSMTLKVTELERLLVAPAVDTLRISRLSSILHGEFDQFKSLCNAVLKRDLDISDRREFGDWFWGVRRDIGDVILGARSRQPPVSHVTGGPHTGAVSKNVAFEPFLESRFREDDIASEAGSQCSRASSAFSSSSRYEHAREKAKMEVSSEMAARLEAERNRQEELEAQLVEKRLLWKRRKAVEDRRREEEKAEEDLLREEEEARMELEEKKARRELERRREETELRRRQMEVEATEREFDKLDKAEMIHQAYNLCGGANPRLLNPIDPLKMAEEWNRTGRLVRPTENVVLEARTDKYWSEKRAGAWKPEPPLKFDSPSASEFLDQIVTPGVPFGGGVVAKPVPQPPLGDMEAVTRNLENVARGLALPPTIPPTFSGEDLESYIPFRLAFEQSIERKSSDSYDRYQYLLQFTSGAPNEIVRSCFQHDYRCAFDVAIKALDKIWGNEYALAHAFLERLRLWPEIGRENIKLDMRNLYFFLFQLSNMKVNGRAFSQLDHPAELQMIADKLPVHLKIAWRDRAYNKQSGGGEVNFTDMLRLVEESFSKENMPVFSDVRPTRERVASRTSKRVLATLETGDEPVDSMPTRGLSGGSPVKPVVGRAQSLSPGKQRGRRYREFAGSRSPRSRPAEREAGRCDFCHLRFHPLEKCRKFIDAPYKTRRQFLYEKFRCFRCLEPGHRVRACKSEVACATCSSRAHLAVMHPEENRRRSDAGEDSRVRSAEFRNGNWRDAGERRALNTRKTGAVFSPAVPVRVRYRGGPWVVTYAALDPWASGGFISASLSQELAACGESKTVAITTMTAIKQESKSTEFRYLEVSGLSGSPIYPLKPVSMVDLWPFYKSDTPSAEKVEPYEHLRNVPWNFVDKEIGLLLGNNEPHLTKYDEIISGADHEPFAAHHALGWSLQGPVVEASPGNLVCHRVHAISEIESGLEQLYRQEFLDPTPGERGSSVDDKLWLERVESSLCRRPDGRLEIALPFRDQDVSLPFNRGQALSSLEKLGTRLRANDELREDYCTFVEKLVKNGHLELVPDDQLRCEVGKCWFLVHHAVYHKVKRKIRVVFDCSRKSAGVSLNDVLLGGPDLMNKLVGVLLHFRQERVAFVGDIEQMFLQLKVPAPHADFMRVMWWPNGDLNRTPRQYRLTSHTFGAVSSPSVANYVVKLAAHNSEYPVDSEVAKTLERCAYMDDIMRSVPTIEEATRVLVETRAAAARVGFNLTGILSNSREVLEAVPRELWAKDYKQLDLDRDDLPQDRVLGVLWRVEQDDFSFKLNVTDKPFTRRGMLSTIGGVYDPLGFVTPVIVVARCIFQETCRLKLDWDDPLPDSLKARWQQWLAEIPGLAEFRVPRCVKSGNLIGRSELHVFCDGSSVAYSAVAYARFVSPGDQVTCTLLMSKARQTPVSGGALTTIPRIELAAAKLAVDLVLLLRRELGEVFQSEYYWSDSQTVLRYIRSTSGRFQRFVENRINFITEHTRREAWHFVPGQLNIADIGSRGLSVRHFLDQQCWTRGPEFLRVAEFEYHEEPTEEGPLPELKVMMAAEDSEVDEPVQRLLSSTGDWHRMRFRVAVFVALVRSKRDGVPVTIPFSPDLLGVAQSAVWRYVQTTAYPELIRRLKSGVRVRKGDPLSKLSPWLDDSEVLRVGGRLDYSGESYGTKHPVILPGNHPAVQAMVRHVHCSGGHFGRSYIVATVQEEYHVVGLNPLVKKMVKSCVLCQRLHGRPQEPLMAELPQVRVTPAQKPFDAVGIDFFGPFEGKRGRVTKKHWGVVFTCLASRAIHLDVTESLDTSAFMNSFRRFVSRRGRCSVVYSDNGTNLVGACREMRDCISNWDENAISCVAAKRGVTWHFNPPKASHYGGVWEREIRSVRKVLWSVLKQHGGRLDRDGLYTAFCEVEAILNARPLTPAVAESAEIGPLTPNHVLFVKPHDIEQGVFEPVDQYARKRWRYVQYLADIFWVRWRKEYLVSLRSRSKWYVKRPNLVVGDLVLLCDSNCPRNQWPVALVTKVMPSGDGVVRRVQVKSARPVDGDKGSNGFSYLERPVHKLVLIMRPNEL